MNSGPSAIGLLVVLASLGACAERREPAPQDNAAKPERGAVRAGLDEPAEPEQPQLDLVVRSGDKDRPIRIAAGRRFGVLLSENASIGYSWSEMEVPDNLRSLGKVGADSGAADGEEPRAGASHGMVFRFEAVGPGRGQLTFQRSYRGDPDKRLSFEVVVER
jgi:predicted secreted protein